MHTGLILTYTNADMPVTLNGYVYATNSILVDGLKFKCAAGPRSRSAANHRIRKSD
jgi:hypothetical protein